MSRSSPAPSVTHQPNSAPARRARRGWLCAASALALALAAPALLAVPVQAQGLDRAVSISAGPLDAALFKLAQDTGLTVVVDPALVAGKAAPAVSGTMTAEEALRKLLAGSGLTFRRNSDGGYVVVPAPTKAVSQAVQLSAQRSAPAVAPVAPPAVIEEVIVTAQKREERLQDVASSVSALTPADIERRGLEYFADFARQLPGVSLTQTRKNRAKFTIRGITTGGNERVRSQDPVSVYLDEMPMVSATLGSVTPEPNLYDVERVEVLRGPQGTLFGSGSMGGAVRIITRKADPQSVDASAAVDLGMTNDDSLRQRYDMMINAPLVEDRLAVRLVGFYRDEEGFVDNIGTGVKNANSSIDWGGRLSLAWDVSERVRVDLTLMHQESEPKDSDAINALLPGFRRDTPIASALPAKFTFYSGTLEYDRGFATITSSSTYARSEGVGDLYIPILGIDFRGPNGQLAKMFTQEVRLASSGEGRLEWVVGGYFNDQDITKIFPIVMLDPVGFASRYNMTNVGEGLLLAFPGDIQSQEIAAFGEVSYDLTSEVEVTGGLRWARSKVDDHLELISRFPGLIQALFLGGGGDFLAGSTTTVRDGSTKDSVLTGKVSLSYTPTERQTYYALASKGYRIGLPNDTAGPDPLNPGGLVIRNATNPDSLWNFEIGAKTRLFQDRVSINLAAFYIPWKDIQIESVRQTDGLSFGANAGKAISKGVELEIVARPTHELDLGLAVTLQRTEVTKMSPVESAITGVVEGDELPNSPEFQVAASLQYTRPLSSAWDSFVRVDAQYVGESVNTFSNVPGQFGVANRNRAVNEAYENINLSVGLASRTTRLVLYVENLTDNRDFIYVAPVADNNRYNVLRPRTVGVRASWNY